MHLYLVSYHFGFDQVFYGKGEGHVENKEEDTLTNTVTEHEYSCGGNHHQADTEYGKKGENGHNPTPENGGTKAEDGKDYTTQYALNQAADTVSFEDGICNFFEFFKE